MKFILPCSLILGLAACESGTSIRHEVTITADTAARFSADRPGLVTVEGGMIAGILCGDDVEEPLTLSIDRGFGCLDDSLKGTDVTVGVWIEPAPDTFDLAALCSIQPEQEWRNIVLDTSITGESYVAPDEPESDWVQNTGSGTWRRDASPCGGSLRVESTL